MGKNNKPVKKATTSSCNDEKLHTAARSGDLKEVITICSTNPIAVNSRDRHSRTPLHLAAWSGEAEVVNYLCKNKADVGAAAVDDMGAIHFAAQKGHLEVIKILLGCGVSVKSCNRKGMTALHYAAQGSNVELVKYLLKKGANTNTKNKAGKTAVDLASSEEIRKVLVEFKLVPEQAKPDGGEKDVKDETNPSLHPEKVEDVDRKEILLGDEAAVDGKDETLKRKDGDGVKETQSVSKKSKVALNHLLATDDAQDEEENM